MGDLFDQATNGLLRRLFYFNGTFGYLITRRGALNLLRHLVPMRAHIDHQISAALIAHPDTLFAYVAMPTLFDHDFSTASGIHIPLEGPDAADQELENLIATARATLTPYLGAAGSFHIAEDCG